MFGDFGGCLRNNVKASEKFKPVKTRGNCRYGSNSKLAILSETIALKPAEALFFGIEINNEQLSVLEQFNGI